MGNANKGLFQTSIEHYLLTLEDIHIKFIHISSLNTILKRLDIVFVNPKKLGSVCRYLSLLRIPNRKRIWIWLKTAVAAVDAKKWKNRKESYKLRTDNVLVNNYVYTM